MEFAVQVPFCKVTDGQVKWKRDEPGKLLDGPTPDASLQTPAHVAFPPSQGININMMPFVMGHKASLPANLQHYYGIIKACNLPRSEHGKVGYLTIQVRRRFLAARR